MKVIVSLSTIIQCPAACKQLGIDPDAAYGRISGDEKIQVELSDAYRWGIIDKEEDTYAGTSSFRWE